MECAFTNGMRRTRYKMNVNKNRMKTLTAFVTLVLTVSILTVGHGSADFENLPSVEKIGDFAAGIGITDDLTVYDNKSDGAKLQGFDFLTKIERQTKVLVFLVLMNTPVDKNGNSDITVKFSTYRPDGSLSYEGEDLDAIKGTASPKDFLRLSSDRFSMAFNESDAIGTYIIKAHVVDHVTDIVMDLVLPLGAYRY